MAIAVYTLTAAWGILLAGRGIQQPKAVVELHRTLQSIGLLAIIAHVVVLVLDRHADVPLQSVLGIDSRPAIVLGAIALWLAILLPVTFALRTRKAISFRAWRFVHWFGYAFWGAAVAHGLLIGTDSGSLPVLVGYGAAIALVIGATAWRIAGGAPARSAREAPARRASSAAR